MVTDKNKKTTDDLSFKKIRKSSKKSIKLFTPIFAMGRYFKDSWTELRMVHWPNRRATWGMTIAVLMFSGLFLALIIGLDAIFSQLFKLIIK